MLESACSRVGHIYRYRPISVNLHIKYDFVSTVSCAQWLFKWRLKCFICAVELQARGRSLDGRVQRAPVQQTASGVCWT